MPRGKRPIGTGPEVPYYPETPARELAKHVRLTADRYLKGTANLRDLRQALALALTELPES